MLIRGNLSRPEGSSRLELQVSAHYQMRSPKYPVMNFKET
jgi:hypothetical protein